MKRIKVKNLMLENKAVKYLTKRLSTISKPVKTVTGKDISKILNKTLLLLHISNTYKSKSNATKNQIYTKLKPFRCHVTV